MLFLFRRLPRTIPLPTQPIRVGVAPSRVFSDASTPTPGPTPSRFTRTWRERLRAQRHLLVNALCAGLALGLAAKALGHKQELQEAQQQAQRAQEELQRYIRHFGPLEDPKREEHRQADDHTSDRKRVDMV